MKVLHQMVLGTAIAVATMSSHAQKTYSVDPGGCGLANTLLDCSIDVGAPQPPLNEYAWGTFNLNTGGTGNIAWENGPLGQLGTSIVSDSFCAATGSFTSGSHRITACTLMTVLFYGNYLPLYGGGSYSGIATFSFNYVLLPSRYYVRWERYVTEGAVKIY